MRRITSIMLLLLIIAMPMVFAGGDKEAAAATEEKVIRVAEQVPGLITPGVWDGQAFSMNSSIYEYLVEINAKTGAIDPLLATSWESEDGKTWTFKLRDDVTFHDGSKFTSEDVKFTIERTQDPDVGHLQRQDFSIVESIETPDDYTVVMHLSDSYPTFIYRLTDYNMMMLSSDYDYASLGESKPMGTGPFKMQQLIPKESAALMKNTEYWDESLPKVDKLLIYFVADIDASISMLESGRVDVVPFVTPTIKNRLDKTEGISIVTPYQEHRFIAMITDMEPFDDNRVRLALKYAMDPEVIARSVAQTELGNGVFYNESPIISGLVQHKDIPFRGRDIEKAKELLAEAGYPNGVSVPLTYASDHPYGKELAQTIQELAAPAGFDIELKGYTRDVYLSQYWMNVPFSITGWGVRIDPYMMLSLAFKGGGPWNESHIDNARVNELIEMISSENDADTRMAYYHELQDIFYEEGSIINVEVPLLIAVNDRVVNYSHPVSQIPQYKYMDVK